MITFAPCNIFEQIWYSEFILKTRQTCDYSQYSPIGSILMTPRCGFDLDPKLKASCPTSLNIQSFLMISSESSLI